MRVLTKAYCDRLAGARENQENGSKTTFFLAALKFKINRRQRKVLLRASLFSGYLSLQAILLVSQRLYKPYLFKTLCAAQRERRFFGHKGLSTCPKPWKSRFLRFSKFRPDLDHAQTFSTENLWSSRFQRMNSHAFNSRLTNPQPISFGISVAGAQKPTQNLEIVDSLWPADLPKTKGSRENITCITPSLQAISL